MFNSLAGGNLFAHFRRNQPKSLNGRSNGVVVIKNAAIAISYRPNEREKNCVRCTGCVKQIQWTKVLPFIVYYTLLSPSFACFIFIFRSRNGPYPKSQITDNFRQCFFHFLIYCVVHLCFELNTTQYFLDSLCYFSCGGISFFSERFA